MKRSSVGILALSILLAVPAMAQDQKYYDKWDTDNDNRLDKDEFRKALNNSEQTLFNEWDKNQNGILEKDELEKGIQTDWDRNKDMKVDESEFNEAVVRYFKDYDYDEYGRFQDWDTDNDGEISAEEMNSGMVDMDPYKDYDSQAAVEGMPKPDEKRDRMREAGTDIIIFSTWDADRNRKVTKSEFTDTMFQMYDTDNDGYIEKAEYYTWEDRMNSSEKNMDY